MSSWARVGVRCICIYQGSTWTDDVTQIDHANRFAGGIVLTISKTFEGPGERYLSFEGCGENEWYVEEDFRPLITKSQEDDISMFKSLLKPTEVPA